MLSEAQCRDAYRKGVALSEAVQHFASEKWRRGFAYASKRGWAQANALLWQPINDSYWKDGSDSTAATKSRYARVIASRKPSPSDYEMQMQKAIWAAVQKGDLLALGFQLPRAASDAPVQVPEDVWASQRGFYWGKSRLEINGMVLDGIRILRKELVPPAVAHEAIVDAPQKATRLGAPTLAARIQECFQSLMLSQAVSRGDADKVIFTAIRNGLNPTNEKRRGLSDSTIRRHISSMRKTPD